MCEQYYTLKNGMTITSEVDVALFSKLLELKPHYNINYPYNDIGMGNLFAECFQDTTRFCIDNQKWYIYDDGVWSIDKGDYLFYKSIITMQIYI